MFQSIQCSMSSVPLPIAASTSWTISTKDAVVSGAPLHDSGGEISPAGPLTCVYFAGIRPPSVQPLDVSVIVALPPLPRPPPTCPGLVEGPRPDGGGCPAGGGAVPL